MQDDSPALRVRAATATDVPAVVALVESAYRGDASRAGWTTEADLLDGQRTDAEAVAEAVAGAGRMLLVVDESDQLLACCQVEPHGDDVCHFGMFAVRPTAQNSGIGRRLLDAAEATAVEMGARTMEMTVIGQRDELIAWYERRGYARTGETRPFHYGDERFGIPRRDDLYFVVLAKPIAGCGP